MQTPDTSKPTEVEALSLLTGLVRTYGHEELERRITEYADTLDCISKSIINVVTTLMESGNSVFSIPMLYHAMTGMQNPTVDETLSLKTHLHYRHIWMNLFSVSTAEQHHNECLE